MRHLKTSFSRFWKNPGLLSILLLEFIFVVVFGILSYIVNTAVLFSLNTDVLASPLAATGELNWRLLLNAKTIITLSLLFIVEFLLFVYLDSIFKSGFYTMVRNTIQDGNTKFGEFTPGVKRYSFAMLRLLLFRYSCIVLLAMPLVVGIVLGSAITFPSSYFQSLIVVSIIIFLIGWFVISLATLYAEFVIVFDDVSAIESIIKSSQLVKKHFFASLGSFLMIIFLVIAGILAAKILQLPFSLLADRGVFYAAANQSMGFILNIFTISATVIAGLYLCQRYHDITSHRKR